MERDGKRGVKIRTLGIQERIDDDEEDENEDEGAIFAECISSIVRSIAF